MKQNFEVKFETLKELKSKLMERGFTEEEADWVCSEMPGIPAE